jgi:hypothetical protein
MPRNIPVAYIPVTMRFQQLVTPLPGSGIEPQDPTGLRPLRAAEAHGREHPADSLVRDGQPFSTLQQDVVGSCAQAPLSSDTDVGERRFSVNDLPKRSEQCLMPRFKRLSRRGIMAQFHETQQDLSPELAPNQRRCQAAQKIS